MALRKEEDKSFLEKAQEHVLFHHDDNADGFITLARKTNTGFKQYHYKPEELAKKLTSWLGEDVYFSQNTFYKPKRRIENIRQLRSLYIDIDCHTLGYRPDWTAQKIEIELFQEEIPVPNLVIHSGRGLVLVWLIDPVPYKALPLWQAVQNYLFSKLSYVGADKKALDAARVFRMDGSINSKNKNVVNVEYISNYRYALRDIQADYLPEIPDKKKSVKKKPGRPKKVAHLYNIFSLHHTRLLDLTKLIKLRDYDMKDYREITLFLYRYWVCCFVGDPKQALEDIIEINNRFKHPLSEQEVIRATKSAEKAWEAKSDKKAIEEALRLGYPGAGYNLKNTTIIDWLDITEEEQQHLKTIIGRKEKYRRNNIRREKERREKGQASREEYLQKQKERTEDKLWQLEKAMEKYPHLTNGKLGELLGVSEGYIRKLKKKL